MKVASHIEKFHRLDRAAKRLSPEIDTELWIWTSMNACVHLLNAALHHSGTTDETDSFHTQVEGLYSCPDRASGMLRDAMHRPGDVMHLGQPRIDAPLPQAVERACAPLHFIEDLRGPYVRETATLPPGASRQWENAYRECVTAFAAILGLAQPDGR
jgi:hypothetical protein